MDTLFIYLVFIFLLVIKDINCSIICKKCQNKIFDIQNIIEIKSSNAINSKE